MVDNKKLNKKCMKSHEPNKTTEKALEDIKNRRGLKKADSVEDLFKKLDQ